MIEKILIEGMKCSKCKNNVEMIIKACPNVNDVEVSLEEGSALIIGDALDIDFIKSKIEESGAYKVWDEGLRYKITPRHNDSKKKLLNHMKRIIGQMNGVMKMIEDDRYCDDVLIQLSAVNKSIKSLANTILDEHMHSCLVHSIKDGNLEAIDEIVDLFKRFQ